MTDEQLIEAMARAMFRDDQVNRLDIAKAALAVCRPIIEAQERKRVKDILREIDNSSRMGGVFSLECIFREIDAAAAALKETGDE